MCNSLILFNKSYKAFLIKLWGGILIYYTHTRRDISNLFCLIKYDKTYFILAMGVKCMYLVCFVMC